MRLHARNTQLIIVLVFILSSKLLGQSTFGSIVGAVKDSSGSVVPMANVKFANEGTAVERTVSTDRSGSYVSMQLLKSRRFRSRSLYPSMGKNQKLSPEGDAENIHGLPLMVSRQSSTNTEEYLKNF